MSKNIENIQYIELHERQTRRLAPRIAKYIAHRRDDTYRLPRDSIAYDKLVRKMRERPGFNQIGALMQDPTALRIMAVTPGDTIAGVLFARRHPEVKDLTIIEHTFVTPGHQKEGIGSAFMDMSSDYAPGDELVFPVLNNEGAIRFYARNGFEAEFPYGEVDLQLDFLKMRRTKGGE